MSAGFNCLPVASVMHDERAVAALSAELAPALAAAGGALAGDEAVQRALPVLYLVLTGGTEQRLLELAQQRAEVAPGEPVYLLAHPRQNSLPAALEALARVQQQGGRGRIIYLRGPEDGVGTAEIAEAAEDLRVHRFLHDARIGLVGAPSDWLVASRPTAETVRETWGPHVVRLEIDDLIGSYRRQPAAAGHVLARSVSIGATTKREPDETAIDEAAAVFPALRAIVERKNLTAVTVRCFDLILSLGTSGCLALAELNDAGIVAGCEGDLVSTVGMLWLSRLLDTPVWMANPAQVDQAAGTLRMAHCTVPRSMVTSYRLRSHFESGQAVGIQGEISPGEVTLVRIGGVQLDRLWSVNGEATSAPPKEDLCRTQLEVRVPPEALAELLHAPLGNHILVVPGRHQERVYRWWQTMIPRNSR